MLHEITSSLTSNCEGVCLHIQMLFQFLRSQKQEIGAEYVQQCKKPKSTKNKIKKRMWKTTASAQS